MKQYCRYCAWCTNGDAYYCGEYQTVMSKDKVIRENKCKRYVYSILGDVDSGKQYKPQTRKLRKDNQINIFERLELENE